MAKKCNVFQIKREKLSRSEGYHLSDQAVGWILGIQPKHVYNLGRRPDEAVRPSFLLALDYAITFGVEACDEIVDPSKEHFRTVVDEIALPFSEIAELLGITARQFRALRNSPRASIPRYHLLAVYYLHHLYGPTLSLRVHQQHAARYASAHHSSATA